MSSRLPRRAVGTARSTRRPTHLRLLCTLATVLAIGAASAQGSACGALDAPFSNDVQQFARGVIEAMHAENQRGHVREFVHVPGWPTLTRGAWEFQYPPAWAVRDSGVMHGWVSDSRDASHLLFVLQDTTQGNPTVEALFTDLLNATIGPHTPCDRVTFVAGDATRRWYQADRLDDVGMVYAWVFRWIDGRFGPMIASLKLDLQARGMYTAYGYVLTSAPEAELGIVVRDAFGPMAATFRGALGGTERDDAPRKRRDGEDGVDDDRD